MIRRLVILDSVLVILLGLGGAKVRQDWRAFGPAHQVSAIQPKAETFPTLPAAGPATGGGASDWTDIPSHNPFSFDRNDIAILAPSEPPKPVGPRPILFGTMALDDGRVAMLASGQAANRNSRPMKVGQTIDGWTVVEIQAKSVVIEANSTRETVIMDDPTVQVPRDYTRTLASAAPAPAVMQPMSQPAAVPSSATSGTPSTSSGFSQNATQEPRVRILQTPFGTVRQTIDEPPPTPPRKPPQ